jgi:xanthine dehydrogenase small subunit
MRLAGLLEKKAAANAADVSQALAAHMCRCTGWKTICEAFDLARSDLGDPTSPRRAGSRDPVSAARRAWIEGGTAQSVSPDVAAGMGGFADDTCPPGSLVAVPDGSGGWSVADTLTEARRLAGKVQGRNSGTRVGWPLEIPEGDWAVSLSTTFVEPAYLEPDASWCDPGGEPSSPVANGGAFGGKLHSLVTGAAGDLASEHGKPVRVLLNREDVVRLGPKRPPIAAGIAIDGSGIVRVAFTPDSGDLSEWVEAFESKLPQCRIEVTEVPGPRVSSDLRGSGWVEACVLSAALEALRSEAVGSQCTTVAVDSPSGARAEVTVEEGSIRVAVEAGEVLDAVVLRSYCIGAVHQALGWVTREGVAVDGSGEVLDLTIRSFGVVPARETPEIEVTVNAGTGRAVNGSDVVFAATAAAVWISYGLPPRWPIMAR